MGAALIAMALLAAPASQVRITTAQRSASFMVSTKDSSGVESVCPRAVILEQDCNLELAVGRVELILKQPSSEVHSLDLPGAKAEILLEERGNWLALGGGVAAVLGLFTAGASSFRLGGPASVNVPVLIVGSSIAVGGLVVMLWDLLSAQVKVAVRPIPE